jgi:hypothetical protein
MIGSELKDSGIYPTRMNIPQTCAWVVTELLRQEFLPTARKLPRADQFQLGATRPLRSWRGEEHYDEAHRGER